MHTHNKNNNSRIICARIYLNNHTRAVYTYFVPDGVLQIGIKSNYLRTSISTHWRRQQPVKREHIAHASQLTYWL